jgi:hypothetical protein
LFALGWQFRISADHLFVLRLPEKAANLLKSSSSLCPLRLVYFYESPEFWEQIYGADRAYHAIARGPDRLPYGSIDTITHETGIEANTLRDWRQKLKGPRPTNRHRDLINTVAHSPMSRKPRSPG